MEEKTFRFTDEVISANNLADGRHVVKEVPGGTKLLAHVVNGKVISYEAEDSAGNPSTLYVVQETQRFHPKASLTAGGPGDPGSPPSVHTICILSHGTLICINPEE